MDDCRAVGTSKSPRVSKAACCSTLPSLLQFPSVALRSLLPRSLCTAARTAARAEASSTQLLSGLCPPTAHLLHQPPSPCAIARAGLLPAHGTCAAGPSHVSLQDANASRRLCEAASDSNASTRCHLLHGAGGEAKSLMADLSRDPTGHSCASAFDRAKRRSRHYPPGSPSEMLFRRVKHACCE